MAEGVAEFLSEARQELAREREAGRLPPERDRFEARYHDFVWRAVNEYVHPAPPLAEIRPVLDALAESETAAFRIIGWSRLLELPDDAGAAAAERLLDTLFSGVVRRGARQLDQESLFEKSAVAATRRLAKAGRLTAFVERMVAKAESECDLTELVGWPHTLLSLIRGDREHAAAFAARLDALIAAKAYAVAVQPAAEFYRQRAALLNAHENRPTRVAALEGGPLDGTANYAITGLIADPPRGRLVVFVQADFNRVGRYAAGDPVASQTPEGLWSFMPADRTWARLEPSGIEQLVNGGDHLLYKRGDVLHRLDLASSAITPLAVHSRGGLAYASQRDAEHAFCDSLLFNARSGRARDAIGTEHAWRPGTGCQGSGIWRVGGELLVFDEFGNRLFMAALNRPPDSPKGIFVWVVAMLTLKR